MIKVLYVIGNGGVGGKWREFRWSLRSLEMYARGADNKVNVEPVVVGCAPDWFKGDVLKMDDPLDRVQRNMAAKMIAACKTGLVKGEFLFSADDHFMTRPRDFDIAPQYWKNPILMSREKAAKNDKFQMSICLARETLLEHGMPAMDFSQHFNTFFNADDAGLVEDLMAYSLTLPNGTTGANVHSLFANAWLLTNCGRRKLVWRQDRKYPADTPDLMEPKRTDRFAGFSISDGAFGVRGFEAWMNNKYSTKSRWEK